MPAGDPQHAGLNRIGETKGSHNKKHAGPIWALPCWEGGGLTLARLVWGHLFRDEVLQSAPECSFECGAEGSNRCLGNDQILVREFVWGFTSL